VRLKISEIIKKSIDANMPVIGTVIVKSRKTGSRIGHFMLIIGYHIDDKGEIDKLYALDPALARYEF